MNQSIPLSQKLYLLGIDPEKGGLISTSYSVMNIILIKSLFLELYLNKNIRFDKKKVVFLTDKTSDPLHRFILEKIKKKSNPAKMTVWLNKLQYSQSYIRKEVQKGLVTKRIIKMEAHQFLFFSWSKSKIINMQLVYHLISDIENRMFKGTDNEEQIMLLLMIKPAGLLKRIFPDKEKRKRAIVKFQKRMLGNQLPVVLTDAVKTVQTVGVTVAVSAGNGKTRR